MTEHENRDPIQGGDRERFERASRSRDPRFDGRFFIGVRTTGIYCRPICPAPTPKRKNVDYYRSAAAAAAAGLRPCRRCHPESAPGTPAWLGTSATVSKALRLIDEGALDEEGGLGESRARVEALATRVGMTDRHLRRLFLQHLGAPPLAIALTRRLHFARRLLDDTSLPIAEVAFASGFGSLRRFNHAFRTAFGAPPSQLRADRAAENGGGKLVLRLPFRAPYDWPGVLSFLAPRATPGVEEVTTHGYRRTFRLTGQSGALSGLLEVSRPDDSWRHLELTLRFERTSSPLPSLVGLTQRVRNLFDVDADPLVIADHFQNDPLLGPRLAQRPGVRAPGAWDGFELAVRAILGQQVTVRGATTLAGRLVEALGEPVPDSLRQGSLRRFFPAADRVASADLRSLGLPAARAETIRGLAEAVATGRLDFDPALDLDQQVARLAALPGIGDWTAQYIAMRALRLPDAFPAGDLGLRKVAGDGEPEAARRLAERADAWRPWRAYAAFLLWLPYEESTV